MSLSFLPSTSLTSSSVSLAHFSLTLPLSVSHSPSILSQFIVALSPLSKGDRQANGRCNDHGTDGYRELPTVTSPAPAAESAAIDGAGEQAVERHAGHHRRHEPERGADTGADRNDG